MGYENMGRGDNAHPENGWRVVEGNTDQTDNVLWWEHGRLRQCMPQLECRAMAYTAKPRFDDALVEAARDFYGLEMDVASVELEILEDDSQRLRFLPWFIWDWRGGRDPRTVGEQFLAEGGFEPHEIRVLEALCTSYVGFYQATEAATNRGVMLTDLLSGERIFVSDDGLVGELGKGEVLQARLVRVPTLEGECVLAGAVYAIMAAESVPAVADELESFGVELESAIDFLQRSTSEMLDFAERLMESLALPPALHSPDGEPLVVYRGRLFGDAAKAVIQHIADAPDAVRIVGATAWCWGTSNGPSGIVHVLGREKVELVSVSEDQYNVLERGVCVAAGVAPPSMRCLTHLERIVEGWVYGKDTDSWLQCLPQVSEAVRSWLSSWTRRWLDRPHMELGDRTPRQAVHDPGSRQRLEWLVQRLEQVHVAHFSEETGTDVTGLRAQLGLQV